MKRLVGCPACARHLRADETRCPFCGVALADAWSARPPRLEALGRFSRAALLVLGTTAVAAGTTLACSDDETEDRGQVQTLYGGPPSPGDDDDDADAGDGGATGVLYGLAPDSGQTP